MPEWITATAAISRSGIRRAHHQAATPETLALHHIARFFPLDGCRLPQQLGIPGFAQADGLRELRRRHGGRSPPVPWRSAHRQPVQPFDVTGAPDTQARYVRLSAQAGDFSSNVISDSGRW